jgi:transcriptional regulator with XRE-family HTH domain
MRDERKEIRSESTTTERTLADLASCLKLLLNDNELTQSEIEAATGVDQATISRAKNGKLERMTEKLGRLKKYADMRKDSAFLSLPVRAAASEFLSIGGSEEELISSIRLATRLVLRHPPAKDVKTEER